MNQRPGRLLAVAAALVVFAAAGCTDPTVAPKSTVTEANIFTDASSYQSFLAKIYAGLAVSGQQGAAGNGDISGIDEGFSQYLRLYWETQELPTDEAIIGWGDIGLPEMNTGMWNSQSNMVVAMYYRIYFQVAMANEFLRQTTDAKLAERNVTTTLRTTIQQYRAEARFLRALSYWHGVDLFGNIPLVTEDDALGATPPAQATRAAIYAYVVSELNDIKTALPAPSAATYGRATTAAANMLLAKLYLNAGVYTGTPDWTNAMTAVSAVIAGGYTLDPSYAHLTQADNNTSPEIIFAITQDGTHTQTWGGMTFLVHASCGGSMSTSAYGIDYCWWGLRMKPQLYNLFPAGDRRANLFYTAGQNVAVTSVGNFNDGIANGRFTNLRSTGAAGSNGTHVDTDFPVFRLADAYLMYAEVQLRGGGGTASQALTYFNALRQRAYGNASGNITAMTLDTVLNERARELNWEAHRRQDLIRFGKYTGNTYVWAWKGGVLAGTSLDAYRALYPLPANELIANPNLTQNPGYTP